jgi:hypothetical protein
MNGAELWGHINDSLKIILWPAVIAWVFFVLRHKIKDRMDDLESFESPAVKARFKDRQLEVAPAVDKILDKASDQDEATDEESDSGNNAGKSTDLLDVREEIEEIIRVSFNEGLQAARSIVQSGGKGTPELVIKWTGSQPYIGHRHEWGERLRSKKSSRVEPDRLPDSQWSKRVFSTLRRQFRSDEVFSPEDVPAAYHVRAEEVATIESEMMRLANAMGSGEARYNHHRVRLWEELREKLRGLDPASPLATVELAELVDLDVLEQLRTS